MAIGARLPAKAKTLREAHLGAPAPSECLQLHHSRAIQCTLHSLSIDDQVGEEHSSISPASLHIMPRGMRVRARIHVKTTPVVLRTQRLKPIDGDGPRLWNAKRRIQGNKGLSFKVAYRMIRQQPQLSHDTKRFQTSRGQLSMVAQQLAREDYLQKHKWPGKKPPLVLDDKQLQLAWWKLDRETLTQFLEVHLQLRTLSQDVKDFILQGSINLEGSDIERLLTNPSAYFSIPYNVPLSMRKQVYL